MNIKSRRALRAVVAVAAASSLLGVQALTSSADATGTTTTIWNDLPSGVGFWSNQCPTKEPTSQYTAGTLNDDSSSVAATRTFVAGPNGLPGDSAWHYAPAKNTEGGIALNLALSTTSLSIAVNGATTGRLLVSYVDTAGTQYLGEQALTTTSGWHTITSNNLNWWQYYSGLINAWRKPGGGLNSLNVNPTSANLKTFLATYNNGGKLSASFQLGCTGGFTIDNLSTTDATGTQIYNLQHPVSTTTTTTASASKVGPGGSATIASTVKWSGGTITGGTTTLFSRNVGASTWTQGATSVAGARNFVVRPARNTQYQVRFNGASNVASSTSSAPVTVNVGPTLALKSDRATMNVKATATFTATFKPARSGVPVNFQQKVGAGWQSLGTASTNSSGIAVFKRSRAATGVWTVRAVAPTQSGLLATNAPSVSIKVYQPVTIPISTSPHVLYVGGSIRIGGVITPRVGGIPLRLQQRVGGRWITYATVRSGPRGGYTFHRRANSAGTATFRVMTPAVGYRRAGYSAASSVRIINRPVYTPPPSTGGGGSGGSSGGSGSGSGGGKGGGIG